MSGFTCLWYDEPDIELWCRCGHSFWSSPSPETNVVLDTSRNCLVPKCPECGHHEAKEIE